jgi:hypothetical protein
MLPLYPSSWNKDRVVYLNPELEYSDDLLTPALIKGVKVKYKSNSHQYWNPLDELITHLCKLTLKDIYTFISKEEDIDPEDNPLQLIYFKDNEEEPSLIINNLVSISLYKETDIGPIFSISQYQRGSSTSIDKEETTIYTLPCCIYINEYDRQDIDNYVVGYSLIPSSALIFILVKELITTSNINLLLVKYPYLFKELENYGAKKRGSYLIKAEHKIRLCSISTNLFDISYPNEYPIEVDLPSEYPLSTSEIVGEIIYKYGIPAVPDKYGKGNKPILIGDGARAIGIGLKKTDQNGNLLPKEQWSILNLNAEYGPKSLSKWLNRATSNWPSIYCNSSNQQEFNPSFQLSQDTCNVIGTPFKCIISNGRLNGSGVAISHPNLLFKYSVNKTLKGIINLEDIDEDFFSSASLSNNPRVKKDTQRIELVRQTLLDKINSIKNSNREYGWNEEIITLWNRVIIKNIYPNQYLKVVGGQVKLANSYLTKGKNKLSLEISLKVLLENEDPFGKLRGPGIKCMTTIEKLSFYDTNGNPISLDWDIYLPQECQKGNLSSLLMSLCNQRASSVSNIDSAVYDSDSGVLYINEHSTIPLE